MQIRTAKELGALIKSRRTEIGWSQQKLADETGVQRLWVIQIEKGKSTAHMGLVLRALRALGLNLDVSSRNTVAEPSNSNVDLNILLGDD